MKVIIAGCRNIENAAMVNLAIERSGFTITEVVSGGAQGVDALGESWASLYGVPIKCFPADWKRHGKAAGPIRNKQMAEYAEALVAVWDGMSRGTANMIQTAKRCGLKVHVHMTGPSL